MTLFSYWEKKKQELSDVFAWVAIRFRRTMDKLDLCAFERVVRVHAQKAHKQDGENKSDG